MESVNGEILFTLGSNIFLLFVFSSARNIWRVRNQFFPCGPARGNWCMLTHFVMQLCLSTPCLLPAIDLCCCKSCLSRLFLQFENDSCFDFRLLTQQWSLNYLAVTEHSFFFVVPWYLALMTVLPWLGGFGIPGHVFQICEFEPPPPPPPRPDVAAANTVVSIRGILFRFFIRAVWNWGCDLKLVSYCAYLESCSWFSLFRRWCASTLYLLSSLLWVLAT